MTAAARALMDIPDLSAEEVARKAMTVAADMCVYTNHNFRTDILDSVPVDNATTTDNAVLVDNATTTDENSDSTSNGSSSEENDKPKTAAEETTKEESSDPK